jgi:8-oxo-dGTP pyrophosphatase MutT (NUDIX family)
MSEPTPGAAPIRPAATVLVLRPRPPGAGVVDGDGAGAGGDVEVLLVRRSHRASFMANAYVFPGGRVDDADRGATGEPPLVALQRAAARELAEEVGLRVGSLAELVRFAHWITPSAEPKRFDTDFFLWAAGADATAEPVRADGREVFDPLWITPADALARYAEGQLNLPPPTACTLEDLDAELAAARQAQPGGAASAALLPTLLARCAARRPLPALPKLVADADGGLSIVMPWDPEYAELPGEGSPQPALALGGAPVPHRIRRCGLHLEGLSHSYAAAPKSPGAPAWPWIIVRA